MYEEQLQRIERWHERFAAINKGKTHDRPTDFYKDEAYAFFLNCYHLKDWIIQDDTVNFANKQATTEEFVSNNKYLSVCADICNRVKHLKLIKSPRSGKEPTFTRADYGLELGGPEARIRVKYEIDTAHGPMDAFELATNCLQAWRDLINKYIKPSF